MTRSVFVVYNKITGQYAGPSYGFRDFDSCEVYLKKNGATARKNSILKYQPSWYNEEKRNLTADDLEVVEISILTPR